MRVRQRTISGRLLTAVLTGSLVAGAVPAAAHAAPADTGTPAPLRIAAADVIAGSYIVVYKKGTAANRLESTVRSRGGQISHRYDTALRGFAAKLSAAALDEVRRDPDVAYVETDSIMRVDATASWGIDRINQRGRTLDGVYAANSSGVGAHVYVIDSGVRATHSEFGGRATQDANLAGDGRSDDCNGHGTHVAGTVGGATVGVARSVRIHAVRVFGCGATTPTSTVIAGVNWVTANAQFPAVINMSLGGPGTTAMDDATNNAINKGITVVAAAGNENIDACGNSPARVPRVVTVANSDSTDTRYSGILGPSNFGACVDLFAPGTGIISAYNTSDTATRSLTGTSMASPHVAGVAALYLNRHARAGAQQVRDAIVRNATPNVVSDLRGSPNLLLNSTMDAIADFNRDGVTDFTVWRPSNGTWYVANQFSAQWGLSGDVPVAADYNRDGTTDIAIFRPSTGVWWVRDMWNVQWGQAGDVPVAADFNGDGMAEVSVFRPSDGMWHVRLFWSVQWGQNGDVPVATDFNGDGLAEVAVWRPSDGMWHVRLFWSVQWGQSGDVPVAGDFNGDGLTDVAVWRPADGMWHVRLITSAQWGINGDVPIS